MRKIIAMVGLWAGISLAGCCGDDWDEEMNADSGATSGETLADRAENACLDYCGHLIECDIIATHSLDVCMDLCAQRYEQDESTGIIGTHCVATASCESGAISACGFDPVPADSGGDDRETGTSDDDAGGMAGASGGGGSPFGEGASCLRNHDCALDEDCVEGVCLARCAASCQCDEGLACLDQYCRLPEEPRSSCETDCDCMSGLSCVDGRCE